MPAYTLPDLTYDYGSLEPHISGRIMQLHHDKHHAAYVKGANEALDRLAEARERTISHPLPASRRLSRSTSPATCCTPSSGGT